MMTNPEAKLYLAEQLPERIKKHGTFFIWTDAGINYCSEIRETEWQQIALWVEEKMTPEQEELYVECLAGLIMGGAYESEPRYLKSNLTSSMQIYRCTWLQRATAMKEAGIKVL